MKSVLVQRLSLRCKFKSTDIVEIAVVDHDTGDCFIHQLAFRDFKEPTKIVPVEKSQNDSDGEIILDPTQIEVDEEVDEESAKAEDESEVK